jgi:magnesium-protoporphyrin O-methyltransferase
MVITFAPRTSLLALMHAIGRLLPHGHRAPAIEPVREATLRGLVGRESGLEGWQPARTCRVASGFYTSQAMEVARA